MRHLNYNHLLYFWAVLREGGVGRAAAALHVTPQTISGQLRLLEQQVGGALFERAGRQLRPSELGRVIFGYADEIFRKGQELASLVRSGAGARGPASLAVGISDAVPKLLAYRMLEPVMQLPEPVRLLCHEGALEALLGDLAAHRLDVVLSASAGSAQVRVRTFGHLLGESALSVFASASLAARLRRGFPASLHAAPWLLPSEGSDVRRALDGWFERLGLTPRIVGEFDDSALIMVFGQAGAGVFAAPQAIEPEVCRQHRVRVVGRTQELRARFYAITTERRIRHSAVAAVTRAARGELLEFDPKAPARPG